MTSPRPLGALVLCGLLAACQSGDQPTTATGRPAISPARRLVARIREDVDGRPKGQPGVDMVALDRDTTTSLSVGLHTVSGRFNGSANFAPSTSFDDAVRVDRATTQPSLERGGRL